MFDLYLKSLEIQGFKSFPEKTRLTFEKQITGIVGPNGSGKSNISDALLWVMGEQSTKTLRGGKMEDVIFGGTQRRNQVGYAEVSLILDNSDGRFGLDNSEVMLTRRYYRSGESEYYINRLQVRLKDVSELLMDTGLGRDGYSVIGQGKISDLLSTKSKDRREIFEEAAGITRYRHRKDESERKLLQTQENLLRIGDKISELELQIDPLREQSEIARRFLKLRDELRGLEITVWLRELDVLRTKADKAGADYLSAKQELEDATHAIEADYLHSESLSEDTRDCDVKSEEVREKISSAETGLGECESDIAVLKSQLEGNAGQIENLSQELVSQDETQDGVGIQISERENRLSEITLEKKEIDENAFELTTQLEQIISSEGKSGDELADFFRSETMLGNEIVENKTMLTAFATQAQELYDMDSAVKKKHSDSLESLSLQISEHERSIEELNTAKQKVSELGNVVGGLKLKVDGRRKKAGVLGEKLERLSSEFKGLEQRKNLLSEMEKDFQGYSKSVKFVMQEHNRGTLKNIHGTVAGLLRTGDKYTVAIETALGGAMQNIIVGNEEDGKSAINLLKNQDAGRATFLPISTIRGNVLHANEVRNDPGYEGIALDLVEYDSLYSGIYASLLGKVVIVDNLNSAIRISKNHGQRFRIVTLDGQVINAGGSMTGGSTANRAGVLSRANEINLLVGKIETIRLNINSCQREFSEAEREKAACEYELDTANAELRSAEDNLLKQEGSERHKALIVKNTKDAIGSFEDESAAINNKIAINDDETKRVNEHLKTLESNVGLLKEKIEKELSGQERLTLEHDSVNRALSDLQAQTAALDAENEALTKAVMELSAIRDEMSGSRERQLETIDGLKDRNAEIRNEIMQKERSTITITKVIEIHKQRLAQLNDKKLEIEAKRNTLSKTIQEKNNELLNMERECGRLEQIKLEAQMQEKQIVDKLWENYELSRSAAMHAGAPIENITQAQRQISQLRKEISGLGNPNIGAIEEFERVNTRYGFLTSQRDDVENAKSELEGIISEITSHMKEIFVREFEIINKGFEKTFKELFGGGRASLILEDPDDVLSCGIEIEVQPPGKSLKTLTLLSGGEKAFVAIAIYFAILAVRPPPFVIMDEIDAALDDANVHRFASHMRRMSNNTQIIVITHKRGTMEESDVLFGVTMQELGISSLLTIDLKEAEAHMKSQSVKAT